MKYQQMQTLPSPREMKMYQNVDTFNKMANFKGNGGKVFPTTDFDRKFIFLLKAVNFFAMMSYDINFELSQQIKNFNKEHNRNFMLSKKFKDQVNKMEKTRERLQHHTLMATSELATLFEAIEDEKGNIKPLSNFFDCMDTFECIFQEVAMLILHANEETPKLKSLFLYLKKRLPKEVQKDLQEPNWEALEKTGESCSNWNKKEVE